MIELAESGQLLVGPDGVGRWDSNGSVIPADCALAFARFGLAPALDLAATAAARDAETTTALDRYRAWRAAEGYSAEERAGMRAAFGPGAQVVDVITGRPVDLG
jgi:hypothetical protein